MNDLILQVETLQNLLISHATGGNEEDEEYKGLRKLLLEEKTIQTIVPNFIKTNRNLAQFWQFIKFEYGTYAERRDFIWKSFRPLLDKLEMSGSSPSDDIVTDLVVKIDSDYIPNLWQKALSRRSTDPEGAITLARTLLESVCKHILDEYKVDYGSAPDINKLYRLVSDELNLAPSQHTEKTFKQILGGCSSVVEGLGSLRNKISDAHGQGQRNFKPSARHAEFAVNLAGTMAAFLFSSWQEKSQKN